MLKRKILAAVTAVCMIFGMTACKNDDREAQTAQAAMKNIKAINPWAIINAEISMPDGWTKEDFFNFFVVNGKQFSIPKTLNELMEFDDKFTYEVFDYVGDDIVVGPVTYNYKHQNCFGVKIFYNNQYIFDTLIYSEEKDEKAMLDFPMCMFIFNKDMCHDAGIDVAAACGLDYNSTYDDVEKIFGAPGEVWHDCYCSQKNVFYYFNDTEYFYVVSFTINEESSKTEKLQVGIYSLDQPIEKE